MVCWKGFEASPVVGFFPSVDLSQSFVQVQLDVGIVHIQWANASGDLSTVASQRRALGLR